MNNSVKPLQEYMNISYRVKCVAVESERIFGDVMVTQQNLNFVHYDDVCSNGVPRGTKRRTCNLIRQTLDGPDFMELNRKLQYQKYNGISGRPSSSQALRKSRSVEDRNNVAGVNCDGLGTVQNAELKRPKTYPLPTTTTITTNQEAMVTSLVDQLLLDIYGLPSGDRGRSESDSTVSSSRLPPQHQHLQKVRLLRKSKTELCVLLENLREHISHTGGLLIRQLRRRDYLLAKRDKQYNVVTAHLQARSEKRSEDTKMKFSVVPQPGESGFTQWLDAMKMVARLSGGIPPEFRKRLWLTLAERHLEQRRVDWKQAEKLCFNEWSNPDDEELGIQIVKDLHRTGCSLFCGTAGRDNQAVLRRVLLGFARWNKSVGYCQGLNVLAALVLQVMDRAEAASVKVMIYLIEGVLPEGYFADNLRGLSVDMAVFRDLLRMRLPRLSRHLEALQSDAKDKATGSSYEPPLTNVFTMQWFLTLFCHCLPQEAVLRVWDLIFLEGDEVLLRTALAIWEGLAERIMTVTSADEFYSIMGVLTREMLEFTDTNNLIKAIVNMGQLSGVTNLREKHRYNITPWARRLSDDEDDDADEDEKLAVAAAVFGMSQRIKKDRGPTSLGSLQSIASSSDRDKLALDINTLKQQYAKLRERQRQAHIILSAACARQSMVPPSTSQAMNHLLVGKSALISSKGRQLGPPPGAVPPKMKANTFRSTRGQNRKDKQGITLHWKDTKDSWKDTEKRKENEKDTADEEREHGIALSSSKEMSVEPSSSKSGNVDDSDSDSTSTELCDEPDRLSDVDSEEPTSTSDCYVMVTDDEKCPRDESSPNSGDTNLRPMRSIEVPEVTREPKIMERDEHPEVASELEETSIAKITDQIRRLSADDEIYVETTQMENKKVNDATTSQFSCDIQVEKISVVDSARIEHTAREITSVFEKDGYYGAEEKFVEKTTLGNYKFLNLDDGVGDINVGSRSNDIQVRSCKRNPLTNEDLKVGKNDSKIREEILDISEKSNFHSDLEINTDIRKNDYQISEERIKNAVESNFNKTLVTLDSIVHRYETLLSFNSDVRMCESTIENVDTKAVKSTSYPVSYVIGHLPISPITVDQKLSKMIGISGSVDSVKISSRENIKDNITKNINDGTSLDSTEDHKILSEIMHFDKHKMQSPKTPESIKSIGSGETMGPDSKHSSLIMSPRTPMGSESQDFRLERSICKSTSSDSKTLTFHHSFDSDDVNAQAILDPRKTSLDKSSPSTPISTDSTKNKSDASPKHAVSSSSDSSSLDRKKSSEKSFSSDLQSPISANSIKYTLNYKGDQDNLSESPIDLNSATSPFYPIGRPNQQTPSPFSVTIQKNNIDAFSDQKSTNLQMAHRAKNTSRITERCSDIERTYKEGDAYDRVRSCKDDYLTSRKLKSDDNSIEHELEYDSRIYRRKTRKFVENDQLTSRKIDERDILANASERREAGEERGNQTYRSKDYGKHFERSCSSLDKTFVELRPSVSSDEFETSNAKKRSSDILEDLKHLEAKTSDVGTSDNGLFSKKTSCILEDLKNLEARRRDTFSNSANGFSKCRLDNLNVSGSDDTRKSYVVEPKINIEEDSDSILKSLTQRTRDNETDDDRESKLGVWTKVKPRKKNGSGRRSSERALKIIQENSAILHKILTCQAKKRLPDLEEISKEITISPINEEISKIFSPILEKIGLNEHEINEELARINFKDFGQTATTSTSEFDAKINDELSRLSLIDDSEDIENLSVDETSHDYLDTREALIDRKINEELSKLLANYEERSSSTIVCREKGSSSQNTSEVEGLDLTSISTNVFSHKSSNDSIETKSELSSIQESAAKSEKLCHYAENVLPYVPPKYNHQDISPRSDIDIYRELEKLDKISSGQILLSSPEVTPVTKVPSPTSYQPNTFFYCNERSPILEYTVPKSEFKISPLKSPYDGYKSYDFKSKISQRKTTGSSYSARSYDKSSIDLSFEFVDQQSASSSLIYDSTLKKRPALSKETLEFRVRYDDEPLQSVRSEDLTLQPFQTDIVDLDKSASYYDNKSTALPKYVSKDESNLNLGFPLEYRYESGEIYRKKYETISPLTNYSLAKTPEYERRPLCQLPTKPETVFGTYLTTPHRRRESHSLSPSHQFIDRKLGISMDPYVTKLSPSLEDVTRRPVSHPEFPDKISASKYADIPSQGSSSHRKSSLSLGNIGHASRAIGQNFDKTPSPKAQFSPFPVRSTVRKPKELGLKLGLYSPTSSGIGQSKRS